MQQPGTDSLTGLVNREAFNFALENGLASGKHFGLLFCDFDRLKLFNDVRGHVEGDALLSSAADALQAVDAVQLAGRIGGDEFAAVVQCRRSEIESVAHAAWSAMTTAAAEFDSELLRSRVAEYNRPLDACSRSQGHQSAEWPPRRCLGVSLVAMWVPPHAKLTPSGLLCTLFDNIDEVRKTQGTGFLVVT